MRLPHPRDVALGARIREVREAHNPRVTLRWMAHELGCTIQQLQKYEKGENRVAWSRLCEIAEALDLPLKDLIAPIIGNVY